MGPLRSTFENLSGPPKVPITRRSLYSGFAVGRRPNVNGLESNVELPKTIARPPLNNDPRPLRLLPNAAACANGDAAPLLTLPLIRNPSAAPGPASALGSSAAGAAAARLAEAAAGGVGEAVTPAR